MSIAYRRATDAGRHMRKERDQPPKPSLFQRLLLRMSKAHHIDGLWIGSNDPRHLTRLESALRLVQQNSPLHYARIRRDLERVWVDLLPHAAAEYHRSINACVFDERYFSDPQTSVEELASTIVHEATHARLERHGILYEEARRTRIEAVCCRRELAFADRIPDNARLRQDIERRMTWYRENPDFFGNAGFQERRREGEIDMLRHLGVPEWLVQAILRTSLWIGRVRGLLRFARS
jgi:hypothetical protein